MWKKKTFSRKLMKSVMNWRKTTRLAIIRWLLFRRRKGLGHKTARGKRRTKIKRVNKLA